MLVVGAAGLAIVAATAILYSQRGPIGTRLAIDYLERRGVPAEIKIERLGPGGFVGSARLGPARDPDLTVDRIEVEFASVPIARDGFTPRIKSIRLVRPRLKARYVNGRLTFGSLQRLVDEFLSRPATGPVPDVVIEDGGARVATGFGELRLAGGGVLTGGRLVRMDARMGRHQLATAQGRLELDGASMQLRGFNQRLSGRLNASLPRLEQGGTIAEGAVLDAAIDLPYGDGAQPFLGRTALEATLVARRLTLGDTSLVGGRLVAALGGVSRGALETLTLDGRGNVALHAETVAGSTRAGVLRWSAGSDRLHLARTRRGVSFAGPFTTDGSASTLAAGAGRFTGVRLSGDSEEMSGNLDTTGVRIVSAPRLTVTAREASAGEVRAQGVRINFASPDLTLASVGDGPRVSGAFTTDASTARLGARDADLPDVRLRGSGQADTVEGVIKVAWRGSLRSGAGASGPGVEALADSLSGFASDPVAAARVVRAARLEAPDIRIETAGPLGAVRLGAPVRFAGEGGGLVLSSAGEAALVDFGPGGLSGGLKLVTEGAALPSVTVEAPTYRLTDAGLVADARIDLARLSVGPLQGVQVEAAGRIAPVRGATGFFVASCAPIRAERVSGDDGPVATALAAQVCAAGEAPLIAVGAGGWSAHGQVRDAGARLTAAEADLSKAALRFDLTGGAEGVQGGLRLSSATLTDRAEQQRFLPLLAAGSAEVEGETVKGEAVVSEAAGGRRLATVAVAHDLTRGAGSAEIDARGIAFAPNGLQPTGVTPLAAAVMTEAEGPVSFTGRLAWSAAGVTSSGRLTSAGLNFRASMGQVSGLKGDVNFSSLLPLQTAPDQAVTIDRIDWLVPLEQAQMTLTLTPTDVRITKAQVGIGGGVAILDPLDLKLGAVLPTSGTLRLQNVDLEKLIAQFNLADKLTIRAKVDGVLPFSFTSEGLRFADGRIFATGPGRLSIKREALTAVSATDATEAPPNAMQSFAYQAMENLAIDQMEARISSQPQGRLGILFHIKGRHDPPVARVPRVSLFDLLQGRAFEQDLPLPKGVPVDLTLDTSLNFDELMAAYSNAGRSTAVQP